MFLTTKGTKFNLLRCFVLIYLKINDVQHYDIGQMNLYMGYFANEEFYKTYPIVTSLMSQLSWTHYTVLITINNRLLQVNLS
ncbi:hypothetical protein COZ71_00485 [Candidatus Desantisbacteria bacterium CG_4_8_14_3_um_filter_40_12]|uniref:YhcG N-terminal domain-containing protein n=1 Tax=Candidatus Desantisbacteria bacterium CG_4_8_14_3_um_filter_40_12 TaxID=1974545 RepID=A0A2M7JEW7_9BACT|nr:MAG: hypothetical protein COZ71_00485 [Candidatus Desantisbacteria bacterium CG_4_8_14_3_um_filter_40_12]